MRVLITAGPTREPIDAVRFISNRSSGRMGAALAEAAHEAGHDVVLLLGPSCVGMPKGVRVERFETGAELQGLLEERFAECDVLIMAAAVADYRPAQVEQGKLHREGGMVLELVSTPDLVAACGKRKGPEQRVVAFALEQAAVLEPRAIEKLKRKGADAIVANALGAMEAGEIEPVLMTNDGRRLLPEGGGALKKEVFARWLVAQLGNL